jgi:hypothetical protein
MLSDFIVGIFRLVWFAVGPFILIAIAYAIIARRRVDLFHMASMICGLLCSICGTIVSACGAVAEALTEHVPAKFAGIACFFLHTLLVILLFGAILCFAARATS